MQKLVQFGMSGVAVFAALGSVPALAQAQKVVPPKTVYWLSAATQSGFGMAPGAQPSSADMMRMAMGGGGGGAMKLLELDIGSKVPPSGPPAAEHAIPPAMSMGPALPLRTPKGTPGKVDETADDFERPKGRLLLFWGCGEAARPGQPVVFDFAKMAAGQIPPNLFGGERVRISRPPSQSGWPTYGRWPNDDRKAGNKAVPSNASLVGAHRVTGNYTPQIDFALSQDWMAPIPLSQAKMPSGAVALKWTSVPASTAHYASMMGGKEDKGTQTVVFWSSSETQTFVSGMSDYIPPAEAARLVGRKQLMPSSQTSCAIPKEAIAAAEGGIISLVSHGPEQNIVHPPRPKDAKVDWVQEWSVKARYVSRAGAVLGMEDMAGGPTASGKPKCPVDTSEEAGKAAGGAILGGGFGRSVGGAIGGLMGGKKKKPQDCEP
jgi:hypothetical protein